jgi:exo-1,4-beta-D-glucosaminidase
MLHMTTNTSDFSTRTIYNTGLYHRYGAPTSLDDYLLKAQVMDYEATRSQFEAYSGLWNAARPATGAIYWMLNNAWPSLHWALYDYYLKPAGAYFGAKVAGRREHVAYDYMKKSAYLINHSLDQSGPRRIAWEVIGLDGKSVGKGTVTVATEPNKSKTATDLSKVINRIKTVVFLRLVLSDNNHNPLSRNVYWLAPTLDTLDWSFDGDASWYYTPVTTFADFSSLTELSNATVSTTVSPSADGDGLKVKLRNTASVPAFFIRLDLVPSGGGDITPVLWSDNYVTLWPKEDLELSVSWMGEERATAVQVSGWNVGTEKAAVADLNVVDCCA